MSWHLLLSLRMNKIIFISHKLQEGPPDGGARATRGGFESVNIDELLDEESTFDRRVSFHLSY